MSEFKILNEIGQEIYYDDTHAFYDRPVNLVDVLSVFFNKKGIVCEKYDFISDIFDHELEDDEEISNLIKKIPDFLRCTNESVFLHIFNGDKDKWYTFNDYNSGTDDNMHRHCARILHEYYPDYTLWTRDEDEEWEILK